MTGSLTWLVGTAMAQEPAPTAAAPAAEPAPAAATTTAEPAPADHAAPAASADHSATAEGATHTEVGHEGGHQAAFPPFETQHFASQILWFIICFGVLYLLMKRVITPRIGAIVEGRAARIEGDIAEAQRLRAASDDALSAYEKALAEARGSAQRIAQQATDEAKVKADQRRSEIESDLGAKLEDAERRITDIKNKALAEVGGIAEDTAGAVVEALLGKAPAADEVKAAVASVRAK